MDDKCLDHLEFTDEKCPDCNLDVDQYGNTEAQPDDYCSFPDCGCDGSRLCMAGEASDYAIKRNVEGMYHGRSIEQRTARMDLAGDLMEARQQKEDNQDDRN